MSERRLFVSFSGGETSGLMGHLVKTKFRDRYDVVEFGFANTSLENDETLDFVAWCDQFFGWGVVGVEALIDPRRGYGTRHRIVDQWTAARNGERYEEGCRKYGIPNHDFPWCTRELKTNPIKSYIREVLGWERGTYDTAVGIRADEFDRRSVSAEKNHIVYPLLDWQPTTKAQVNGFWKLQPRRLYLTGWEGNCKTCWKKSERKLVRICHDAPEKFDFFERMEAEHAGHGAEFEKYPEQFGPDHRRRFFRGYKTVSDIRRMATDGWGDGLRYEINDDARVYDDGEVESCAESCEVDLTWSEDEE